MTGLKSVWLCKLYGVLKILNGTTFNDCDVPYGWCMPDVAIAVGASNDVDV